MRFSMREFGHESDENDERNMEKLQERTEDKKSELEECRKQIEELANLLKEIKDDKVKEELENKRNESIENEKKALGELKEIAENVGQWQQENEIAYNKIQVVAQGTKLNLDEALSVCESRRQDIKSLWDRIQEVLTDYTDT